MIQGIYRVSHQSINTLKVHKIVKELIFSNAVCWNLILIRGNFFEKRKKSSHIFYNRWRCTQAKIRKYACQSKLKWRSKLPSHFPFPCYRYLRLCIAIFRLVDKTAFVKLYYLSHELLAEPLQWFWREKKNGQVL